MLKIHLKNLFKYKDLFFELVKSDIKIKYRNSLLGVLWSMLNPLLMMIILTIVFSGIFKQDIPNFPVYVLIGRILFEFFSESTNFAMNSIVANAQLIRKVYVPRYFFPLSRITSSFITTAISLIPLCIVMLITGINFNWVNLLFLVPLFFLFVISAGIGLILCSINVFFRDISHLYSILLQLVMFTTAIFYPASIIPDKYLPFILLNPLFVIVDMFRDIVMYSVLPNSQSFLLSFIYMLVYGVIGLWIFYKTQSKYIYHL